MTNKEKIEEVRSEGQKCNICRSEISKVKIPCEGKKKRGEPEEEILACLCLHGGDFSCNCGSPCYSFF